MIIRALDFETFEFGDPPQTEIVEAGWCDIARDLSSPSGWNIRPQNVGTALASMYASHLVDPGRPISPESMAVHHISNDDVRGKPKAEEALREAFTVPLEDSVFVAHYAEHELTALGGPRGFPWIDTWKVAIHLAPKAPSWSLRVLQYWLDLDVDRDFALPAHRAGPDAYVCAALLLRMLAKLSVEEMVRISAAPAFLPRLGFGKHAKDPIGDVPSEYLDWILRRRTADGGFEFDKNVVYTAQAELTRRQEEARR